MLVVQNKSSDLKIPLSAQGYGEGRLMDSLKEDHHRFLTEGLGNIKRQKTTSIALMINMTISSSSILESMCCYLVMA